LIFSDYLKQIATMNNR